MTLTTIIVMAVALAMDCFAVSVSVGIANRKIIVAQTLKMAFFFGLFQALMPLVGWAASAWLGTTIARFDHFIAFGLLAFIGAKMIYDALSGSDDEKHIDINSWASLLWLAVATSIDALAAGITYGLLGVDILMPVAVIGVVTMALSVAGNVLGAFCGNIFGSKAEIAGGVVLILLGIKILLEHLGVI